MAAITFLYRSALPETKIKIRLFYRYDNKKYNIEASTKIKVTKLYWDKYHTAKRINDVTMKNTQAVVLSEMNAIENFVLEKVDAVDESIMTKEWLKDVVQKYYTQAKKEIKQKVSTFLVYWFERYAGDRRADASLATIKKANVVKQLLIRFEKHRKKKLYVKDVGVHLKVSFEEYCQSQGYSQNTIARAMVFIKTVCNHSKIYDIETSSTLDLFKSRREKVKSIYLDLDDIAAIEKLTDLPEPLDNARDWLLVSCYTGQRVSDFMRFEKSMIRYQESRKGDLKALIEFTQQKTSKLVSIPLVKKVVAILDKREGEFPRPLSGQKYNDYLKEVCKLAELNERVQGTKKVEQADKVWRNEKGEFEKWELVSSHIGRRSFATNNYGKIPTVFLMNMTGHGTEAMFLTYIGKANKDIAMELSEYFD